MHMSGTDLIPSLEMAQYAPGDPLLPKLGTPNPIPFSIQNDNVS